MAVHMFIFYWGMLSSITPPVAIASFAAAGIAGASKPTAPARARSRKRDERAVETSISNPF
ncbi:hypothetical protein LTR94_035956, partial [Friedmanniomyces endolithicus]